MSGCATHIPLRDIGIYYYASAQHRYVIVPTLTTPKGIRIDAGGGPINLRRIDRVVDAVETCLSRAFGIPPALPEEYKRGALCVGSTFPLPLERSRFTIRIARDWMLNAAKSEQFLPIDAGHGCEAKGQAPPCFWRAVIVDDPLTLVVPPSMYLLPDVLIRVSTGCLNPWALPAMATCAMPTTGPLDDGTGE